MPNKSYLGVCKKCNRMSYHRDSNMSFCFECDSKYTVEPMKAFGFEQNKQYPKPHKKPRRKQRKQMNARVKKAQKALGTGSALGAIGGVASAGIGLAVGTSILGSVINNDKIKQTQAQKAVDEEIAFQKEQIEHENETESKTETVVWTEPDGKKTKLKFDAEGNLIDRSDLNG